MKLRVLSGRHRGAEMTAPEAGLVIGSGAEADLILSDASVHPRHVRMSPRSGRFLLEAIDGAPLRCGSRTGQDNFTLRAGETVHLGEVEVVLLHDDRIDAPAEPDVSASPSESQAVAGAGNDQATPSPSAVEAGSAPRSALVAVLCLVLATGSVGWLMIDPPGEAQAASPLPPVAPPSVEAVQAELTALGFPFVKAKFDYQGKWVLNGVVDDNLQAERVKLWAGKHLPTVRLALLSGTELASNLAAELDDPGVSIKFAGGNRLLVNGAPQRASTPSKIVRAQGEWGGVVEIQPDMAYQQGAQGKPVATQRKALPMKFAMLSTGPTAFIESTDGARYFIGSSLPDGSVVKLIEADRVVVEAGGKPIEYRFVN